MRKVLNGVVLLCVVLLFAWLLIDRYIVDGLIATSPVTQDSAAGRTIPWNVHGTVLYLTREEAYRKAAIWYAGWSIAALGGAAFLVGRILKKATHSTDSSLKSPKT